MMGSGLVVFIVLINLIVFGFIALMTKWKNELKREKIRAEGSGNSLGTGELRGLIQEAMHDVIAPVEERLDLMEMHMRRLPEHDAESEHVEAILPDEPTED